MPDEPTGESGAPTADSTVPANTGGEQTGGAETASATVETDIDVPAQTGDEVDEDEVANEQLAEQQTDSEQTVDTKTDATTDAQPGKKEPKVVVQQREQINSLETQIKPLRELEAKILEIGGLPVLEMAQPLVDAVINPESKAGDIIGAIAQIAPHHDAQSLAWGIVDENKDAVVAHFCGEGITPDIVEKLVEGYADGKFKLDDSEAEDDVFITDAQRRDREKARAAEAREKAAAKAEADARSAELNTQRQATLETVGKLLEGTVNQVLTPYAVADNDTDEVKGLKTFLNGAIHATVMRNLAADPTWQRTQQLLRGNGFKAAEALAKGALTVKIQRMTEELVRQAQPFVEGAVGKAQQAAKKIKEVRDEPTGATTQADVSKKEEEISAKDPKWREKLDAQYEQKFKAIQEKNKRRDHQGRFTGTGM